MTNEEKDHGAEPAAVVNDTSADTPERQVLELEDAALDEDEDGWVCVRPDLLTDAANAIRRTISRYESADAVLQLAMEVLVDWHRGDSPRGTEQCPECGRFPYEGHRNECRLIYAVNRWRARLKVGSGTDLRDAEPADPTRRSEAP